MQQQTLYLPNNTNYCVTAKYQPTNRSILFFSGKVLNVYNYARVNSTQGRQLNYQNMTLCARIPNSSMPSKLLVAPCFLPNIFAGDYWVTSQKYFANIAKTDVQTVREFLCLVTRIHPLLWPTPLRFSAQLAS